mgnify:CR=1 FL=1
MRKILDISPAVHSDAPVFPGDTAYQQAVHFSHGPGCPVTVHTIKMSPHTGAHADAPMHYAPNLTALAIPDVTRSVKLVKEVLQQYK